jgi:serine/threonine protein kinase
VFALGIVLFELVTGERLFRGESAAHSLELVKKGKIPSPAELNPKLPPQLVAIVQKSLERDLDRRYQTAREMSEALGRFLIDDRVLVSHASVGQLVKRVLGSRIESQRQALREALTAADGVVAAGLVPDRAVGLDRSHPHFSSGRFPVSPSEPPSSISSKSSTPHPQSLELRPKRESSPVMPAIAALFGLSAAAGALWFVNNQSPPALRDSGAGIPDKAAAAGKTDDDLAYTPEPGPWGVNVDALPAERTEVGRAGRPPRPGDPSVHAGRPGKPDKTEKPDESEREALEKNPYKVPEAPPEVPEAPQEPQLEPPPSEKPPPVDQRAPLNRASALTALSKAAGTVASCKRPDGPTGTGSVAVTFSTEGPVSAVNVPAPFAGTPTGSCIQTVFRNVRVPAFSGSSVTVNKSFRIPD